ncbi:MAG: hypothetical protein DRO23_02690 [Thermoprotei archaeon]|nr:MAG: hypothetical protein DRO23_02690 [Thermoprotei archaeon]
MKIRKMSLADVDLVAGLLARKYPGENIGDIREHTLWHVKGFPEICLIAEDGGEIKGFIICHLHVNSLEIEDIYVAKGKEYLYKRLILEVLNRIPKVDTVTVWLNDFKELLKQLK